MYITGWKFWETFLAIKEVFIEKEYDWLDVTGRKVLDLGAFTGDSAISFAMRGATEVYTCEPNPNMIQIVRECGIVDGCLKMDIEGSEYEVINATRLATLRKFRQMQIDFHKINGKSYKSIKKKLEKAGFDCKIQFVGTCEGGHIDALSTRT